jgi:D-alanine--poly(phosphoribitol) ligase subunit 1
MHLIERIDAWTKHIPEKPAQISSGVSLTYRQLIHRSDVLGGYLAHVLPDDDSPIAVIGHKEPEMLVAFLAAVKSGHPYIPIDTATPDPGSGY